MKNRLLCLIFALAVSTHSPQASACDITGAAIVAGFTLWGATIVASAFMIGWSTEPKGDYNQEYNCGGRLAYCCTPSMESGKVEGTNCTTESVPNAKCTGKYLFCASETPDLVQAPYVLQKWAKDMQIAGAVILSVTGTAAIILGIVSL